MTQKWNGIEKQNLAQELAAYQERLLTAEISADTTKLVFGEGPSPAFLMLIGEAPGSQEVLEGRPFVGKAGKQLDAFLAQTGLQRDQLYVGNAVKYRPTKPGRNANRTPGKREIDMARPLLMAEICAVQPAIIATLGNSPLYALTQDQNLKIGEVHGRPLEWEGICLFPLYHPASVIYNRALEEKYEEDLQRLKAHISLLMSEKDWNEMKI